MFKLMDKKIIAIIRKLFFFLLALCFRVFTVCKDKIDLYIKNTMYNFLGEILTSDPSIYMMDHSDLTLSKFMENSIGQKNDKL